MQTTEGSSDLLVRIGLGDRSAVAPCIERYSGLVWSLARQFLANEADAEEAVQEIFTEVWTSAARYDAARSGEVTFISMIARRRLIDAVRSRARTPRHEPLDPDALGLSPEGRSALEASAETERVLRVIDSLGEAQREVLRLSAGLGYSHGAIAEKTGLPLGTVKSHLRRGLKLIREQLGTGPEGLT